MERALRGAPCVGVRASVPDGRAKSAKQNLAAMIKEYEGKLPSSLPKLWKFVLALPEAKTG